ncbi:hypothetical protein COU57_02250 [Candidatus Pacearchaeota archaeon CG10_big_fil_rev_8_21_14_0_10_32_14]|nr:MAG: hypothetical protein COU57_02250 [Candidatus Pacearchaeota archaeon CG10_big_fil_rev_8_21_14_0_10_32_14]
MKKVKIVVFVPTTHTQKVLEAIGKSGGGVIGNYSYCSFLSEGVGRFKPNEKANPFIGKSGEIETVKEDKLEFICPKNKAKSIIKVMKEAHPYEEVAFDIYPLLDESEL